MKIIDLKVILGNDLVLLFIVFVMWILRDHDLWQGQFVNRWVKSNLWSKYQQDHKMNFRGNEAADNVIIRVFSESGGLKRSLKATL